MSTASYNTLDRELIEQMGYVYRGTSPNMGVYERNIGGARCEVVVYVNDSREMRFKLVAPGVAAIGGMTKELDLVNAMVERNMPGTNEYLRKITIDEILKDLEG